MPVNGSEKLLRLVSLENEDVSYRLEVFSVAQLLLISQRVNLSFSRLDIELHLKVLALGLLGGLLIEKLSYMNKDYLKNRFLHYMKHTIIQTNSILSALTLKVTH